MENLADTNKINESKILTVIVLDDKNQPTEGARVSISPSNESGQTNSAGEIQFKLGDSMKYEIKASNNSKTVTVPYYVTKDGATRLVVNPTYVRSIEKKLHPSFFSSQFLTVAGIGLGVTIIAVVVWKLFKKRK
jgi:hypothetical protein